MVRTAVRITLLVVGVLVGLGAHPTEAQEAASLEALGWMAGCWRSVEDGVVMEEIWMVPAGGLMLGLHRDIFPTGEVFFEYLRVVGSEDGISYVASPGGREPTPFALAEAGERRVVFENPDHDFPRRITYWSDGATLSARIGGRAGDTRSEEWTWSRVDCPGS